MVNIDDLQLNSNYQPLNSLPVTRPEIIDETKFRNFYRVPPGFVDYYTLSRDARFATAVVSLSGERGTFKDLQAAIAYVNDLGGGTIFVKAGTYFINKQISIYSNINIIGEGPRATIFDLSNYTTNDNCFLFEGTEVTTSGTITLTNGDATVTGSSTSFSTAGVQAGDFLYSKAGRFEVSSVTNDTSLELTGVFSGGTESSLGYAIAQPIENILVSGVKFTNMDVTSSANAPVLVNYADYVVFDRCEFSLNETHLNLYNTYGSRVYSCVFEENTTSSRSSFVCGDSTTANCVVSIRGCVFNNNQGYGLTIAFKGGVIIQDCSFSHNLRGIDLSFANNCIVSGCIFNNNNNYGISNNDDENIISNNIFADNGTAIYLADSSSNGRNVITGNRFTTSSDYLYMGSATGRNIVTGNSFFALATFKSFGTARTDIIRSNLNAYDDGWDNGTATITSGTTSGTVTFNDTKGTGNPESIIVTPTSTMGSASYYYVTNIGTASFVLNLDTDPGTTVTFNFRVDNKKP